MGNIVVKFSTLRGGVFIEQSDEAEYRPNTRCFRASWDSSMEYALYGDLVSNNPAPRWYAHAFPQSRFTFC